MHFSALLIFHRMFLPDFILQRSSEGNQTTQKSRPFSFAFGGFSKSQIDTQMPAQYHGMYLQQFSTCTYETHSIRAQQASQLFTARAKISQIIKPNFLKLESKLKLPALSTISNYFLQDLV